MPPAFAPPAHLVRAPHPRCVCGSSPRRTRPVRLRTPPRRPATYAASDAASPDTPPLLEMRDISYRVPRNWDVRVFNQMNFSVRAGEFVIVIGENGAGKSTGTVHFTKEKTKKKKKNTQQLRPVR